MIRKSGYRFSLGTNASVCPKLMLERGDQIMIRFNRIMI
jgi:hypothetical protein